MKRSDAKDLALRGLALSPPMLTLVIVGFGEIPGWDFPAHSPLDKAGPGWGVPGHGISLYLATVAVGIASLFLCMRPLKRRTPRPSSALLAMLMSACPWLLSASCCLSGPYVHPGYVWLAALTSPLPVAVYRAWHREAMGWPPRAAVVVLLGLFVGGILGLCEGLLRVATPESVRGLPSLNAADRSYWHFDPNREAHRHGVHYQFSGEGHRDGPAPVEAKTRILLLGDSIPFGGGFPLEMTFPKYAQSALRSQGHSVEVINAGIPAFSLKQIRAYYESVFASKTYDWVVLSFYIDDINRPQRYKREDRLFSPLWPEWLQVLHHGSRLWNVLSTSAGVSSSHLISPRAIGYQEAWPTAIEELTKLRQLAVERGAKFALLNIPYFTWASRLSSTASYEHVAFDRALSAWCADTNTPVHHLLPELATVDINTLRMSSRDIHLNAHGHETVGRSVGVWLARLLAAQSPDARP